MDLEWSKQGAFTVVKLKGRMDAVAAPDFEKACASRIDEGDVEFIADLSGLEYISSAGLRSILSTAKKLKAKQGRLSFCALQGMVQEVFSVSGFASMFSIHGTLEEALSA